MVSNLVSVPALVGTIAKHKLVNNYSDCKVVNRNGVVLPEQHLRRHVPRSAARVLVVLRLLHSRHSQVRQS